MAFRELDTENDPERVFSCGEGLVSCQSSTSFSIILFLVPRGISHMFRDAVSSRNLPFAWILSVSFSKPPLV